MADWKGWQGMAIGEKISTAISCLIPADFPSDLRAKLAIAFILMNSFHLAEPLVNAITLYVATTQIYFDEQIILHMHSSLLIN